jgi:protein-S-isoprenylcysteine O-methyltransferase Ste14
MNFVMQELTLWEQIFYFLYILPSLSLLASVLKYLFHKAKFYFSKTKSPQNLKIPLDFPIQIFCTLLQPWIYLLTQYYDSFSYKNISLILNLYEFINRSLFGSCFIILLQIIGLAFCLGGCFLTLSAFITLGKSYSPVVEIQKGQKLRTRGVYAFCRHPMYAGLAVFSIGQIIIVLNLIAALSSFVGFLAIHFLRVSQEESILIKEFGKKYEVYMLETGRYFTFPKKIGK